MTGRGAGADRGLVPAVPEPLDRRRSTSGATARCTSAAATARASTSSTTARTARPAQPVRRPAGRRRRDADTADRRGRRAAHPGPAHDRRPGRPSTARSCASTPHTGAGAARQPAASRARTPNARRIVAYGLRNPFRYRRVRPGTNELWVGDVGWNTWEEINRIADHRPPASTNFGWPCYEGAGRAVRLRRRRTSTICENLYAAGPGAVTRRTSPTTTAQHGRRRRDAARPGSSSITGIAFYRRRQLPGRVRRGAVLRRLPPRLHLGRCSPARTACPTPTSGPDVRQRRRESRSTCRSAPAATCSTSTRRRDRSGASRYDSAQPAADRGRRSADPTSGAGAARPSRSTAPARPTPPATPLTYAWDLDGDGAVRRLDRRRARRTPTRSTARTPPACASPTPTAPTEHRVRDDHRGEHAADGDDHRAPAGDDGGRSAT